MAVGFFCPHKINPNCSQLLSSQQQAPRRGSRLPHLHNDGIHPCQRHLPHPLLHLLQLLVENCRRTGRE
jgi:hypothetical protein